MARRQPECHRQFAAIAILPRVAEQRLQRRRGQRADAVQLLETTDRLMLASDCSDLLIEFSHSFVEPLQITIQAGQ